MEYADSIPHQIFTVTCQSHRITTTVTGNPTVISNWIYDIRRTHYHHIRRGRLIVGLGVQWKPTAGRGGPPTQPATLQLCVGANCLIIQLRHTYSVPNYLRKFLSDESITFVGVWNQNDNAMLQRSPHNLYVSRLIELREVAFWQRGLPRRISMERLAESVIGLGGVEFKPGQVGRSDWEAYYLSGDQVLYATIDAFVSFLLGKNLEVWDWEDAC